MPSRLGKNDTERFKHYCGAAVNRALTRGEHEVSFDSFSCFDSHFLLSSHCFFFFSIICATLSQLLDRHAASSGSITAALKKVKHNPELKDVADNLGTLLGFFEFRFVLCFLFCVFLNYLN